MLVHTNIFEECLWHSFYETYWNSHSLLIL